MIPVRIWTFATDADAAAALRNAYDPDRRPEVRARIVAGVRGGTFCVEVVDGEQPKPGCVLLVEGHGIYRVLRDRRWLHPRQLILATWPRDVLDSNITALLAPLMQEPR